MDEAQDELRRRVAELRDMVDTAYGKASPQAKLAVDAVAASLQFTGDTMVDLRATFDNLRQRMVVLDGDEGLSSAADSIVIEPH